MRKAVRKARKVALVTGASSGIGEAFARRLGRDGFDLVVVARRKRRLSSLAREISGAHAVRVEALSADLTTPAGLRAVTERIAREPRLELLVNDAGVGDFGPLVSREWPLEETLIRVNVVALARLTHAALRGMVRRRRGAIVNVSSTAAFAPCPGFATYGATKAFVNSFTEALHEELRGTGVRVQALCPGLTHTEIFEQAGTDVSSLPDALWMDPEAVVEESLAALARGAIVCVPGLGNRAVAALARLLPHAATSRITGVVTARVAPGSPRQSPRRAHRPAPA